MKIPPEILVVAEHLGDLREEVVFVGGMVRSLLVTDPVVPGYRPTKDVDVIVDVPTYAQHAAWLEKFRARGFKEDTSEDAPICRYVLKGAGENQQDLPVDVMPLDSNVLGFSNRWYPDAFESATLVDLTGGAIRVVNGAHFVATKLLSFQQRGDGDFYHHDLEDVIVLVDGRPTLIEEVELAAPELRVFVADAISDLLSVTAFRDALPGHLPPDATSQARVKLVLARLTALSQKNVPESELSLSSSQAGIAEETATIPIEIWTPERSSNVRHAVYDAAKRELLVTFHHGGTYLYTGVPASIFDRWRQASSPGAFHHRHIRASFSFRRVSSPKP